ncbi:GH25 family lysozyme [Nitratireductor sp. XY-223]|uniref:glycoside hydrolase family 25 protein n=1 Tax=Nitratireductor sp. XY-223 TaxID=2561926 RepID=UPI00145BDDC7|nr:GH25 family lysozyme [Nitratireductor sp. XY-223]
MSLLERLRDDRSDAPASGIDVSRYQGTVDWGQVRDAGISFVAIKATEGASDYAYTDYFTENAGPARQAGLVVGGYHFFNPQADGKAQADYFLQIAQPRSGDLLPMLDLEQTGNAGAAQIAAGAQAWLETVATATGKKPLLYTTAGFWSQIGSPGGFGDYPLWVAEYGVDAPRLPQDWSAYTIWQHSQSGKVAGIDGAVDLDIFNGGQDQLHTIRL